MRRFSILAAFCVVCLAAGFCTAGYAAPFEFHGGVYTAYEYTDNYLGTPHDEESESIYEVGPSASLRYSKETTTLDLAGHWAKSFHRKFDQNDSNDIIFNSTLATSTPKDTLSANYGYTQSDRRDVLTEVRGYSNIQTAGVNYSRALSPLTTAGLAYSYLQEDNPFPYEDIVSNSILGSLSHQLSQRSTVRGAVGYDTHRYEVGENAEVTRSTFGYTYLLTQRASIGTDLEYQHESRDVSPDGDISTALLTFGYSLTPSTRVLLSGGYNWLSIKGMDREGTYATRGELTTRTLYDTFSVRVSREYVAEFTTDRYGTYEARSLYGSWERALLRDLRLLSTITYEERKPVSAVETAAISGWEDDFTGLVSMVWTPLRYVNITGTYEHFERKREIIDTERENRYRVSAEVRY